MLEQWPNFDKKFDYILFPESFGVAFLKSQLKGERTHRFHDVLDKVTERVLKGEGADEKDIDFFKSVVSIDNKLTVKKLEVLSNAIAHLNTGGEIRLDGYSINDQELAFIVLKLREDDPEISFKWIGGGLIIKKP